MAKSKPNKSSESAKKGEAGSRLVVTGKPTLRREGETVIVSARSKSTGSMVGRILQLTSLAPDVVESILEGGEYSELSLRDFRKGIPVLWEEQRRVFSPKGIEDNLGS
ncbi:MAG: hypothetical protein KGS49_03285 [Planctomycetes bacterium]|nr:hypothetical protein [Planctomycetota bacterium]